MMRLFFRVIFSSLLAVFSFFSAEAQPSKISGEILAHQREKASVATVPKAQLRARLLAMGIGGANLDREDCALYVKEPLSDTEIAALAVEGIVVSKNNYVPPVPGHHPYGFYLATVEYSSLVLVENDPRFVRLETAELLSHPMNDLGGYMIHTHELRSGTLVCPTPLSGAGVKIAVADSGIDLTHPDFPVPAEKYDMTDGTDTSTWGSDVSNLVTDHGTHVTGSALGRGTQSAGKYCGSATAATLYFYKIGNDANATSSSVDEVEAVNRALAVGCDIFTMSYGGYETYNDGSGAMCQAIDAAVVAGLTVFISAGNSADDADHYSVTVAPGGTSGSIAFTINNTGGSAYTTSQSIRVIWIDDNPVDQQVVLACSNLGGGESLASAFSGTSARNTEGKRYTLTPNIPATTSKTYTLTVSNGAGAGSTPLIHLYMVSGGFGKFDVPDKYYVVGDPAVADLAIAVAAWTQRRAWVNYQGNGYEFLNNVVGTLAPFSSWGPRIDGVQKPDLAAPGAATISTRDSARANTAAYIIDNDGLNQNGSGPAQYYLEQGTSMACPLAAGAAALLLEGNPGLTPAQLKSALTSTAAHAGSPNDTEGYGLINLLAAAQQELCGTPTPTPTPGGPTNTPTPTATPTNTPTPSPTPGTPTATPTGKPDLFLPNYSVPSLSVTEGDAFFIRPTIKNTGFNFAGASHARLFLSTDGDNITSNDFEVPPEKAVPALAVNAEATPQWNFNFPSLGGPASYSVWPIFVVDSQNEVNESEENNTFVATTPFTVTDNPAAGTTTPTNTATNTPTPTPTFTRTNTPTSTNTATFTPTPTPTNTSAPTATLTPTPTATNTGVPTATFTPTPTFTHTPTVTATPTHTTVPVDTDTPTPTATPTNTGGPTVTDTPTASPTATATPTHTTIPVDTDTPTPTATPTETGGPTVTITPTASPSATATPTHTTVPVDTDTPTPTATPTHTGGPTATPTATIVPVDTDTPTPTHTGQPTATFTPTPTNTTIPVDTDTPTATPTPTLFIGPTLTFTPSPTSTLSPTATPTATPTLSGHVVSATAVGNLDGYVQSNTLVVNLADIQVGNGLIVVATETVQRGFVSFNLPPLAATQTVVHATLALFQASVIGNPYGKLGSPIVAEPVDLGAALDAPDFAAPPWGPLAGILSSDASIGLKILNVATAVNMGYATGRAKSEFRLRFAHETDGDSIFDRAQFESSENTLGTGQRPTLLLELASYEPGNADFNSDGQVDRIDLLYLSLFWNTAHHRADLDGSGTVDQGDVLKLIDAISGP